MYKIFNDFNSYCYIKLKDPHMTSLWPFTSLLKYYYNCTLSHFSIGLTKGKDSAGGLCTVSNSSDVE